MSPSRLTDLIEHDSEQQLKCLEDEAVETKTSEIERMHAATDILER